MKARVLMAGLALLSLTGCAHIRIDPWDKTEQGMAVGLGVVMALDMAQTLNIATHPEKYSEMNPILGVHPSRERVAMYFPIGYALQLGVAHVLPHEYRKAWLGIWLGAVAGTVVRNFRLQD